MGKQIHKVTSKNQTVLKMGVGEKQEKFGKKKAVKLNEKLQTIHEEGGQDDPIITEVAQTKIPIQECGKEAIGDEDSVKDMEKIDGSVKILVTKRKEVTDEEEDQDVVIEALRNIQDLVEYWISSKMAESVQDIIESDKILQDVIGYSDWLSELKVIGSRVIRVEVYFTLITTVPLRELVDAQIDFIQMEGL